MENPSLGGGRNIALADGVIVDLNHYDNQLYCYGKGPTAITVEAPLSAIPKGTSIMIRGIVTDESPGTKQLELASRFPHGVPAIADEDMQAWMEYLYIPRPMPLDAVGVEVVLETLDPNGDYYEIGRVTSDASGMFKLMWEPPDEGEYTIVASFAGSKSYWGSTSETAIGVTEAPSPGIEPTTEPPTTEPPPTGEAPLITTEVAIAISIIITAVIGIAAYWTFRIRKAK